MNLNPDEGIAIFTDGSANTRDKSGGWAWVALDAWDGYHHDSGYVPDTTIGKMELTAPAFALFALAEALGPCDVLIYCDSQYVVMGANDPRRQRKKNKEEWADLDSEMARHTSVTFVHVKGHNDTLYNEIADRLAGEARKGGIFEDSC